MREIPEDILPGASDFSSPSRSTSHPTLLEGGRAARGRSLLIEKKENRKRYFFRRDALKEQRLRVRKEEKRPPSPQ